MLGNDYLYRVNYNNNKTPNFFPSTKKIKRGKCKTINHLASQKHQDKTLFLMLAASYSKSSSISVTLINSALTNICEFRFFKKMIFIY